MGQSQGYSKIMVIKLGGHSMPASNDWSTFCEELKTIQANGIALVLVHGGGPYINDLLQRLGLASTFIDGLRVTDDKVMEVAEMVLCAGVNKEIVRNLEKYGIKSVGISGQDGGLLEAEPIRAELGHVGRVDKVNPDILITLLDKGYLPVIAPIALDRKHEPLNVNADTAAGAIAGAVRAEYFVLYSNVPGILDTDKKLLPRINKAGIKKLMADQVIHGGMIPKTECCLNALACGCARAIIMDGTEASLRRFIVSGENPGTVIEL